MGKDRTEENKGGGKTGEGRKVEERGEGGMGGHAWRGEGTKKEMRGNVAISKSRRLWVRTLAVCSLTMVRLTTKDTLHSR